jgi:rubrerythrin
MSTTDAPNNGNGNGNGNGDAHRDGNGDGNGDVQPGATLPPPAFPAMNVLDEVLYDYFRRSDKMGWSPYDLVEDDNMRQLARPDRLNEYQRAAVKTVLFVEDHLPGYLSEYLRIMTDPDVTDDQHITNRNTLHFTFRWVAEEDRHAHVLERYLVKSGLCTQKELALDMMRERKQAYIFPYQQLIEGFIYLALQEKATHLYYRALAKDIEEPLLKTVLGRMGADEASHGKFFYDLLIKSHKGDLDALARKISSVANDFKMPVQNNLLNYRRQLLGMMRAAPSYRHGDVFQDMMDAVDKAAKDYSRDSLQLITPELGRFLERDNTGGYAEEPTPPK